MQVANYSDFRKNLKYYFEQVVDGHEKLIIHRQDGQSLVLISLEELNALDETAYITSQPKNAKRLKAAIREMNEGSFLKKDLSEE